jgi:hypothetical protein
VASVVTKNVTLLDTMSSLLLCVKPVFLRDRGCFGLGAKRFLTFVRNDNFFGVATNLLRLADKRAKFRIGALDNPFNL